MFLVRDFSWQRGVNHFGSEDPRIHLSELPCGFAYTTPYQLRRTSNSALTYPPASSLHFTITDLTNSAGLATILAERSSVDRTYENGNRTGIGGCRI
jgi:hypothetical protein